MLTWWFFHRTSYDRFFKHRHVSMFHLMVYNMEVLAIPIRDLHTNITPGSLLFCLLCSIYTSFYSVSKLSRFTNSWHSSSKSLRTCTSIFRKIVRGWWSECEAEQCGWWQVYTLLGLSAVQSRVLICVCVLYVYVWCKLFRYSSLYQFCICVNTGSY